jgi:hypothetical protein
MSFGHRHDPTEIGQQHYMRAMANPQFTNVLRRPVTVNLSHDVPLLGGYSKNGRTIYIDKDAPQIGGGLEKGIITHEHLEKTAKQVLGLRYHAKNGSHELATAGEHDFVKNVLGMHPADYEKLWHPVIKHAESKMGRSNLNLPPDLDMEPYSNDFRQRYAGLGG